MLFSSLFRGMAARPQRTRPRRGCRQPWRPRLEVLEDRTMPSTLTVLNTLDSGAGSLRQAILDAAPGDTIAVTAAGTIALNNTLTIDKDLTVSGPGRDRLTVSGQKLIRDFAVFGAINVTLSGLTIADGYS